MYWNWLHCETYDYTSRHSSWSMMNYFYLFYDMNKTTKLTVLKISQQVFFLNLLKRKIFSLVASGNYFLHFFNDNKLPVIKCSNSKVDFHWHLYFHLSIDLFLENYTSLLLREQQNLTLSSFEQQIALFGLIRQKLCDAKKSVDRQKRLKGLS